jgi:tetratricopeptide (TPR) repeat protein
MSSPGEDPLPPISTDAETLQPAPSGAASKLPTAPAGATTEADDQYATTLNPRDSPRVAVASLTISSAPPGYEIECELGRGGMGVVYKARQEHLKRTVALKMILAGGHAGVDERVRFMAEAEAIAAIAHPGIVQIHEFGTHEGLPFFALEFCAGGPLSKKLAGTPLPPREAVQLVEQIARAMQAAHERGIIHRDLKPGNILLAACGFAREGSAAQAAEWVPKITDFGLAKRVEDDTGLTQTGAVLGTPSYMAPEQAEGKKDVGPAVDVYALGAILYECLTGRPPFKAATPLDTLRQVVADDPVPPAQLNDKVPHDLETVCLKCLRKEPGRRYASAAKLADELGRWQRGEPVHARPVGMSERSIKWARRRPAVAALGGALILGLVVGIVGLLWFTSQLHDQREIARKERDKAEILRGEAEERQREAEANAETARKNFNLAEARFLEVLRVIDRYFTDVSESTLLHEPGLDPLRQKLLHNAREFYARFVRERGDDPLLQRELARSQYRLALIDADLGDLPGALRLLGDAQGRFEKLSTKSKDAALRHDEGLAWQHRGRVCRLLDRLDEATAAYQKAVELLQELRRSAPNTLAYQESLGTSYLGLGNVALVQRQGAAALGHLGRALDIRAALVKADPANESYQRDLGVTWGNLAQLYTSLGKKPEALKAEAAALDAFRRLVQSHPERARYQADLARTLYNQGTAKLNTGEYTPAMNAFSEAIKLLDGLVQTHPAVTTYQEMLGFTLRNLALACRRTGQTAAALAHERRERQVLQKLADAHPEVPAYQAKLAHSLRTEGQRLNDANRHEDALKMYSEAQTRLEAAMGKPPVNPYYRSLRCELIEAIGVAQHGAGRLTEAQQSFKKVLTICADLEREKVLQPTDEVQRGYASLNIGLVHRDQGEPRLALPWFERALRVAESLRERKIEIFRGNSLYQAVCREQALTLDQLGRFDDALRVWDAVLAREKGTVSLAFQVLRLRTQAGMADYPRTIPIAERLAKEPLQPVDRICLACVYGRLYQSAAKDDKLTVEERNKLQQRCVRAALGAIEKAPVHRALSNPFARKLLETDPDLAPVRQRQEFKTILAKER